VPSHLSSQKAYIKRWTRDSDIYVYIYSARVPLIAGSLTIKIDTDSDLYVYMIYRELSRLGLTPLAKKQVPIYC